MWEQKIHKKKIMQSFTDHAGSYKHIINVQHDYSTFISIVLSAFIKFDHSS